MPRFLDRTNGDVVTVPDVLADRYEAAGHERLPDASPDELRGGALDQALDDAGLSKSGTVEEKRDRLTEHLQPPTE